MKLRGKSPEAYGYRAALANGGLAVTRALAGIATGNFGFFTDMGHDVGDVISLGAKAHAMEGDVSEKRKFALRLGAAGLFLAGGLFGIGSSVYSVINDHAEDASPVAVGLAVATAAASIEIGRRTHRGLSHHEHSHNHHDHNHSEAAHDTRLHVLSDAAGSTVYAVGLGAQAVTEQSVYGTAGLFAAGVIATSTAVQTLNSVVRSKKPATQEN